MAYRLYLVALVLFSILGTGNRIAWSAPPKSTPVPQAVGTDEDVIEVEKIKKKYWTQGEEGDVGVVQNRLYTKSKKFELGGFWGFHENDPFLSVKTAGGTFGFHFDEYFSVHAVYMKFLVNPSSALKTLQTQLNTTANTNKPDRYIGGEIDGSILYGKLSLIGKMILYFDLHLTGGAGSIKTENGSAFAPTVGIGQKIYLHRMVALRADYRWLHYNENVVSRSGATLGQKIGERSVSASSITLGLSFFLDFF